MRERNLYFDFLKGLAIMMVVAIHTMPIVKGFDSFGEVLTISVRLILNCAVPLFLALSGFFMARKTYSGRKDILAFWKKQIPRVYIPMLVCGLGWFVLALWQAPNGLGLVKNLLLLFSGGFSIFYFVTLIVQCYLLTPWLSDIKWGGVFVCALLSAIAIIITTYCIQIEGRSFPLLIYAGPVYLWIVFYALGMYIAKNRTGKYLTTGWILIVIGYLLQFVEAWYYLPLHGGGLGIKPSSFLFSAGIIMVALSPLSEKLFNSNKFTRSIAWLGEISFGVYLIHCYVIVLVNHFLHSDTWIISWLLTLTITVGGIYAVRKILPINFTFKYLGF